MPTTRFDLTAFAAAIQARDAVGQLALYAPDAEVHDVNQPAGLSAPTILRGQAGLSAHLRDVCRRQMTHAVTQGFADEDNRAFEVSCTYPNGTRVLCRRSPHCTTA